MAQSRRPLEFGDGDKGMTIIATTPCEGVAAHKTPCNDAKEIGGSDGTRTRDLLRDRQAF
jgi:hypothetical protein